MAFKSATSTLRPQRRLVAMHASPKVPEAASAESNPWGHIAGWSSLAIVGQAALVRSAWAAAATGPSIGAPATGIAVAGIEEVAVQNPLTTGLFGLAVVALLVVTGGAAYLAITGILDERREKSDRVDYSSKEASRAIKKDQAKRRKQKKPPKSKSGRGFS